MKKYIAYTRVSTKRQGVSGLGLEAQRQIILNYVPENSVIEWFEEKKSGKDLNELPMLNKAKEMAKANNATLVIAKTDRLRNTSQALDLVDELGANGVFFCNVGENADKFMLTIYFAFAERERTETSIRTKLALESKRKRGEITGGSKESWGKNSGMNEEERKEYRSNLLEDARYKSAKSKKESAKNNPTNKQFWDKYRIYDSMRDKSEKIDYNDFASFLNKEGVLTQGGKQFDYFSAGNTLRRLQRMYK